MNRGVFAFTTCKERPMKKEPKKFDFAKKVLKASKVKPTFFALLAGVALLAVGSAATAQTSAAKPESGTGMISIIDVAPATYLGMLRYPKFFGDPNMDRATVDGPLGERQYLLGSLGGARDTWVKNGFLVDGGITQAWQGAVSGPGDSSRYYGSADLWLGLDTGRAGLWSGGLVFAHIEGNWGHIVQGTGALLPLNFDTTMPGAPSRAALSELYLFQGLPNEFAAIVGKVNWSAYADTNLFANDERNQFMYVGLVNNPILGAFVPYTSLGGGLFKQFRADLGAGIVITSNNTNALSAGFDEVSASTMTYGLAGTWTPKLSGRPGMYALLAGYTTKNTTSFDVDKRYLLGEILGAVPVAQKDGNYALAFSASQYLWVDGAARRSDGKPVGIGPFFRFGLAPKDRNVIDQFYSLGVGGYGGLFGRSNDNWGVGWARTHFSSDLRGLVEGLGARVDASEDVVEAFYNIAITPAVRIALDLQYINSANPARDNATVLGTRLQLDF